MEPKKIRKVERIFIIVVFVLLIISGSVFGYITSEIMNYTGIDNLKAFQPSVPTRLYDVNGDIIAELFQEKRILIFYEDLPQSCLNAFIAVEDQDFYEHFGLSFPAIMRAMGKNIIASVQNFNPTIVQGGSTITQQLAKRLFTSGERTFARKAMEAVLALQIEKKFSKEEILEMYFNQIYLGHGCHGIATAAEFFFDKDFRNLSLAESSLLAALPSKPYGYSPLRNPRNAFYKHRDTLNRMEDAGFISKERADQIYEEFWPAYLDSIKIEYPTRTAITRSIDKAPYFTDYVRQSLITRFGEDLVYKEGLNVYTTLDLKKQRVAQNHIRKAVFQQDRVSSKANKMYNSAVDRGLIGAYDMLRMIFSLPSIKVSRDVESMVKKEMAEELIDPADILSYFVGTSEPNRAIQEFRTKLADLTSTMKVQGAIVAIEPSTGFISTMVGGSRFEVSNQYNRAVQALRQPGSSFKPFVYGAAIEAKKLTTGTLLIDAPIVDIDSRGEMWAPGNYEDEYKGMVAVDSALAGSINIIAVRVYDIVGAEGIVNFASRMLKVPESRFSPNPTLALGTTEVTPLEMANAYAIFANRGRDVIPFAIRYVVDRDGNELANVESEVGNAIASKEMDGSIQVISEEVAWIMTQMMMGVVDRGTATESIRFKAGFKHKAAGKTGTNTNWTDAWFCGFTPDISAVVWVGYDRLYMSLGRHQAGASVAAPIWGKYMRDIYNGMEPPVYPDRPKGVVAYGGNSWGLPGAQAQYHTMEAGEDREMKSVIERYMEKEGIMPD